MSPSKVSVLNREPMWLKSPTGRGLQSASALVSVLNREPMWLKSARDYFAWEFIEVSVLNREPMWLKFTTRTPSDARIT